MECVKDITAVPENHQAENVDEGAELFPYNTRRKTSSNESVCRKAPATQQHGVFATSFAGPTSIKATIGRKSRFSELDSSTSQINIPAYAPQAAARFPIDGHDPVPTASLCQLPSASLHSGASSGASQATLLHRMMSSLSLSKQKKDPTNVKNVSLRKYTPTLWSSTRRRRQASIRNVSTGSAATTNSSMMNCTVANSRSSQPTPMKVEVESPNPLRAPPHMSFASARASPATGQTDQVPERSNITLAIPVVADAVVQFTSMMIRPGTDKLDARPQVLTVVDVKCSLYNSSEHDPSSSKESLATFLRNSPGCLKDVLPVILPAKKCDIVSVFGDWPRSHLNPNDNARIIVHTVLDPSLCGSKSFGFAQSYSKHGRDSNRGRPASAVLMNQVQGMFKKATPSAAVPIFEVQLLYSSSLFKPSTQCSSKHTCFVKQDLLQSSQQSSAPQQAPARCFAQPGPAQAGNGTERTMALALLEALKDPLSSFSNTTRRPQKKHINANGALRILNAFLCSTTSLDMRLKQAVEGLQRKYQCFINEPGSIVSFTPPTFTRSADGQGLRINPLQRRNENAETFSSFPRTGRRGVEIDRESVDQGRRLVEITNRSPQTPQLTTEEAIELEKHFPFVPTLMPEPLFSPMSQRGRQRAILRERQYLHETDNFGHPETDAAVRLNIGKPEFYQDEVKEAANISLRWRSPRKENVLSGSPSRKTSTPETVIRAKDPAKQIWEHMRLGSQSKVGSGAGNYGMQPRCETDDEDEQKRVCKAVGAPWLA